MTKTSRRLKLVVAYDGTDYSGWAAQTGRVTVQGTLTDIVRRASGEECVLTGSSRTDAGAHAQHQVVHWDTGWKAEPSSIPRILNNLLPADISVRSAVYVPETFHARFSAQDRHYRYRIRQAPRDPLLSRFVFDSWQRLDVESMHQVAQTLVGSHDFLGYSEEVPPDTNPVRELFSVQVRRVGREVWIDIVGNAFMRGMMRRISGGLFEVGRGKRDPQEIAMLLEPKQRDAIQWPVVLPARGLCLMRVRYGRHPRDLRERYKTNDFPGDWKHEQNL